MKHRDTKKAGTRVRPSGSGPLSPPSLCLCVFVSLCFSSNLHDSRTVTEMIHLDVQLAEHGKQQVRHRRVLRITDVPSAFETARRTAGQKDGKRGVIVLIAVTHRAAVEHHGMVEKIAVAIRRVL